MQNKIIKSDAVRLFTLSFLILFFELVCIRWIPSYVLYLGYFRNFVLLGALLGIGAGALLADKPYRLFRRVPILMLLFFAVILLSRAQVSSEYDNFIFFTSTFSLLSLPAPVFLPLIFIGVAAMFTFLSQELGQLFTKFAPLKAYNINIIGSLAGIAAFTIMSFFSLSAWIWFLVAGVLIILLLQRDKTFGPNIILVFGLVAVIWVSDFAQSNFWSPYSKLNVFAADPVTEQVHSPKGDSSSEHYLVYANGIQHQVFNTLENSQNFYDFPYTLFTEQPNYQEVLIIGAGGGNDVSHVLANTSAQIDAVEIDRQITNFGKSYHPENPYQDARVTIHIDDGRSFLGKSDKKYDLIIFALPDSLTLASNTSNLRLESYLFTEEAFESVNDHLKSDGLFILYNYFRYDWLVNKLGTMLENVFEIQPVIYREDQQVTERLAFTMIFAGPKAEKIDTSQDGFFYPPNYEFPSATDDWPFLYLDKPSLPGFYTISLGVILILSFLFIQRVSPKGAIRKHGMPFFFMGAAFTLLEAKSIVQFLLLFGSTWIVNALVFFAILVVVLIANSLAAKYRFENTNLLYVLLALSLVINFVVPLKSILVGDLTTQYIIATIFLFSPIFFANLIYSSSFRDTAKADISYGANLLGTMLGGAVEYLSLYFGYRNLVIVVGLFYLLAFIYFLRDKQNNKATPVSA